MDGIVYKYHGFLRKYLWILAAVAIFQSCGVKKSIPDGKFLLKKNLVSMPKKSAPGADVRAQILHRPNKRVLFNKLPVFLWAYTLGTNEKNPALSDSVGWRRTLRKKFGEPPVLLDTNLAQYHGRVARTFDRSEPSTPCHWRGGRLGHHGCGAFAGFAGWCGVVALFS